MDYLSLIQSPIKDELQQFGHMFNEALSHSDGLLSTALSHIRQRGGKRMRPMLILLMARNCGGINESTLHAALGLELLHTASLVHDDVVDESMERRGQASVNAQFDNKVAVLVGDYVLSTALLHVSLTHHEVIFRHIAELGRTLSNGEILQLTNTTDDGLSEEIYYHVIRQKTAALFESCCAIGALSAGVPEKELAPFQRFGQNIGMIFQIRDDIFDYYDSREIGKPTGNDMAEGKLTLPVLYALREHHFDSMATLARKVKAGTINPDEIAVLVEYAKTHGGIEYAERRMEEIAQECRQFIHDEVTDGQLHQALTAYLDFVIHRNT